MIHGIFMMMTKLLKKTENLHLYRHANGIKLIEPENADTKYLKCHDTGHTVTSILQLPFNIYFLDVDSVIQISNLETVKTCGFQSVRDSVGRTVKDVLKKESALDF